MVPEADCLICLSEIIFSPHFLSAYIFCLLLILVLFFICILMIFTQSFWFHNVKLKYALSKFSVGELLRNFSKLSCFCYCITFSGDCFGKKWHNCLQIGFISSASKQAWIFCKLDTISFMSWHGLYITLV